MSDRADLLRKWVAALESGTYQQGQKALRCGDRFCCLGVLCDISGEGKWRDITGFSWYDDTFTHSFVTDEFDREYDLPPLFRDEVGLSRAQQDELIEANDRGETFAEIAKRIRGMFPCDVFATVQP